MAAPVPRRTKPQGDQFLVSTQSGFLGGLNTDMGPASIDSTEIPELHNVVAMRQGLRSRRGDTVYTPAQDYTVRHITQLASGIIAVFYQDGPRLYLGEADALANLGDAVPVLIYTASDSSRMSVRVQETASRTFLLVRGYSSGEVMLTRPSVESGAWDTLLFSWNPTVGEVVAGSSPTYYPAEYIFKAAPVRGLTRLNPAKMGGSVVQENPAQEEGASHYWAIDDPLRTRPFLLTGDITPTASTQWYAIYRTRNVGYYLAGETAIATGNDRAQYFLCAYAEVTPTTASFFDINTFDQMIGTDWPADEHLAVGGLIPTTFDAVPSVLEDEAWGIAGNYMFFGRRYTSVLSLKSLLLYLPGVQELEVAGEVSGYLQSYDSLLILTPLRSYRATLTAVGNAGIEAYGEYWPILGTPSVADSSVGVRDFRSVAPFGGAGAAFARCSDGSVRIWDGTAWGRSLTKGKVEAVFGRGLGASGTGVATSDGTYFVAVGNQVLRYSLLEKNGNGWSTMSPPSYEIVSSMLVRDATGEHPCWVQAANPYEVSLVLDLESQEFSTAACQFSTREFEGSMGRQMLRHLRTTVQFTPLPGNSLPSFGCKFKLYMDSQQTPSQEVAVNYRTMTAVFSGDATGHRFRVGVETTAGGFFVTGISTEFQSMDLREWEESYTGSEYDKELNSNFMLWQNRPNPLQDSSGRSVPAVCYAESGGDPIPPDSIFTRVLDATCPLGFHFRPDAPAVWRIPTISDLDIQVLLKVDGTTGVLVSLEGQSLSGVTPTAMTMGSISNFSLPVVQSTWCVVRLRLSAGYVRLWGTYAGITDYVTVGSYTSGHYPELGILRGKFADLRVWRVPPSNEAYSAYLSDLQTASLTYHPGMYL